MAEKMENYSRPLLEVKWALGSSGNNVDSRVVAQVLLTVLVAFLVYHYVKYSRNKGPTIWPFLGSTPQFLWNLHRMHDWNTDLLQKYNGTYTAIAPKWSVLTAVATCRYLTLPSLSVSLNPIEPLRSGESRHFSLRGLHA